MGPHPVDLARTLGGLSHDAATLVAANLKNEAAVPTDELVKQFGDTLVGLADAFQMTENFITLQAAGLAGENRPEPAPVSTAVPPPPPAPQPAPPQPVAPVPPPAVIPVQPQAPAQAVPQMPTVAPQPPHLQPLPQPPG